MLCSYRSIEDFSSTPATFTLKDSYNYDPRKPHWGYKSWNDFFGRSLNNQNKVRPNNCKGESTCLMSYGDSERLTIRRNLKLTTKVNAKNEEYSLLDLFAQNKTLADYFLGGTLMQTVFMPFDYHRFHAPVSGKIVYAKIIPGLLFTLYDTSVDDTEISKSSGNTLEEKHFNYWLHQGMYGYIDSLTYIAPLATRALMVIDQEDGLGYVAAIAIGLQSISSVIMNEDIIAGAYIKQGHELGRFQYGGSSGIILVSDPHFQWFPGARGNNKELYKLGEKIGQFKFCVPGSGKTCTQSHKSTSENHRKTALGFPVI